MWRNSWYKSYTLNTFKCKPTIFARPWQKKRYVIAPLCGHAAFTCVQAYIYMPVEVNKYIIKQFRWPRSTPGPEAWQVSGMHAKIMSEWWDKYMGTLICLVLMSIYQGMHKLYRARWFSIIIKKKGFIESNTMFAQVAFRLVKLKRWLDNRTYWL